MGREEKPSWMDKARKEGKRGWELGDAAEKDISETMGSGGVGEKKSPLDVRIENRRLDLFREELVKRGGEWVASYPVNPDGIIEKTLELMVRDPGLTNCSEPTYGESGNIIGWAVTDLKAGAEKVSATYQDIKFNYPDDPTGQTFTWRARIENSPASPAEQLG